MAAQTFSASLNIDDASKAGLANGDDVTINTGATLTRNSDSRWGQQAAVVGSISIDAATGGKLLDDASAVWWVPYDASTGNVPALGTAGTPDCTSVSGPTGEFLGVWTALGVAPTAAAAAMPATGYVKFRSVSAAFADNDVVTLPGGATITVNSTTGGERGWLHLVHGEAETFSIPRLGEHEAIGDWFYLGVATGAADETFQFYVADRCPAVEVETGAGTDVYEIWVGAGGTRSTQTNRAATDARGKVFKNDATGLCTFGISTGITFGATLPAGARVRVPNIHYSSSTSANWANNTINTTPATRIDWLTTSAGAINLSKVSCNGYLSFSQPYSVELTDVYSIDQILVSECATKPILTRAAVGLSTTVDTNPINVTSCFSGVDLIDCVCLRYEAETGDTGTTVTDCDAVTITGGRFMTFGDNTAATIARGAGGTGALTLTRVTNSEVTDVAVIGAALRIVSCINVVINDLIYGHLMENQDTTSTNPVSAIDISSASADIIVDGYGGNFGGIANLHPYNALVAIAASYDCIVKNIGTKSAPYDCGSANQCAGIVAFAGNGSGNTVRRCYCQNARSGGFTDVNSEARTTLIDVWGDGADTGAVVNALNATVRGMRSTNPVTGATAVYGSHFYDTFISTTEGRMVFLGNEPTALSGSKLTVTSGTAKFTSTGQCKLTTVGDEVTWEMDYFWLGITALNNAVPTFSGTNSANHVIEFQYDTGSGWNGSWLTATGANLAGVGAITPATGIKLKVRARCGTASATNAIINLRITATTDATSYLVEHPIGVDATYSLTGLDIGTEVVLFDASDTEVDREVIAGSTYAYTYFWETDTSGWYALIWKDARVPIKFIVGTLTSTNVSIPVSQSDDLVYDGTLVGTDTTIDPVNSLQIADSGITSLTVPRIYSEWKDWLRLTNNAQYDFAYSVVGGNPVGGVKSIPKYVFQANGWKFRPDEADHTLAIIDGILVGESGADPFVDTTGAYTVRVLYEQPVQAIAVNGASTIAPSEAEIKAWVRAELATEMTRIDVAVSTRLATAGYTAPDNASAAAAATDAAEILDLVQADEYHTATTVEKKLKGTATVLLTKNWTGTPLSSFQAVDPP